MAEVDTKNVAKLVEEFEKLFAPKNGVSGHIDSFNVNGTGGSSEGVTSNIQPANTAVTSCRPSLTSLSKTFDKVYLRQQLT